MTKMRDNDRGFTMVEMLIAIGIIVVLLSVTFIAVASYQRGLKRTELDRIAQEIFVAAQNHLSMADSQGVLAVYDDVTSEAAVGYTHERTDENGKKQTFHYFYIEPLDSTINSSNSVLYDILPPYSIDETIRGNSSFVIEYDLQNGIVTNVFYCDQTPMSSHIFSDSDWSELFTTYLGDSDAASEARLHATLNPDSNLVIGWYGGGNALELPRIKLYPPTVSVENDEVLAVKVMVPLAALNEMARTCGSTAMLQVLITGTTPDPSGSDIVRERLVNPSGGIGEAVGSFVATSDMVKVGDTTYRYKTYMLDDITNRPGNSSLSNRFTDQTWSIPASPTDTTVIIPGEDIKLRAKIILTDTTRLANPAESAERTTNSLFADLDKSTNTVRITSFRHLENLDTNRSGLDLEAVFGSSVDPLNAIQRGLTPSDADNLSWPEFLENISKNEAREQSYGSLESDKESVHVHGASAAGLYLPVNNSDYKLSYDGNKNYIEGVVVETTGNAGLFGSITAGGASIKNLELKDFDIKASGGSAGALAGSLADATINNVIAYNTTEKSLRGVAVAGTGNAGGLVGTLEDCSLIKECASSIYVQSESGSAGGLIGSITNVSNFTDCYAAGHTKDGQYLLVDAASTPQHVNVISTSGNAGGLVGKSESSSIAYSYATTSVKGGATAGGLVGDAQSGSIVNCYTTGLVLGPSSGTAKIGQFAGSLNITPSSCLVYDLVNANTKDAASCAYWKGNTEQSLDTNTANSGVSALDKDIESYNEFFTLSNNTSPNDGEAHPYDSYYSTINLYPAPSIENLTTGRKDDGDTSEGDDSGESGSGEDAGQGDEGAKLTDNIVKTHYGDWPTPETLVINRT